MSILLVVLSALLGLAIFMISLRILSAGLQGALANRLRPLLARCTVSPWMGLFTGAVATAVIQSSSAVAVMMVALVHARVLTLYQAFGIILGANIGTTMTAQIVSFEFHRLALPMMICGLFLAPWRSILVGFGGIFYGLHLLRLALAPLLHLPIVAWVLLEISSHVYLGAAVGLVLTVLVQSSSAVTGIVIAVAGSQGITLTAAVAIAAGSNIGTVATTLISSIGLDREARAAAYADLIFNVLGVALLLPGLGWFVQLAAGSADTLPRQIANAHTYFNVITAFAAVWFIRPLTNIACVCAGIPQKIEK